MNNRVGDLRDEAMRYRRMADAESDAGTVSDLLNRAFALDAWAAELEAKLTAQSPAN